MAQEVATKKPKMEENNTKWAGNASHVVGELANKAKKLLQMNASLITLFW